MANDESYMARALELAAKGRGRVEPNPMVGAVIVRENRVIGEGYHGEFGGPHAEVEALKDAERSGGARGAVLYVTLEPCNHEGKTPPCTDALIRSGLRRVVYAMKDPNPGVAGGGAERLKAAGMEATGGVLERQARRQNAPFIKFVTQKRPYVTAKWAMTLDGKIATHTGDSKWITCELAREYAHRLRSQADAVLVGAGTVRADNPELTARFPGGRNPRRFVLAPMLGIPLDSVIVRTAKEIPTYIFACSDAPAEKARQFEAAGCRIVAIQGDKGGVSLDDILDFLGREGVTNLLIEGGSYTHSKFFEAGLVDRILCFIAPKIIGGREAPGPIGGEGFASIGEAVMLKDVEMEMFENTFLISGILMEY
jgi:diaminohydroxyphosphoribosylaminopyrimidine deaminase/5-amino-6-(5-phosphoribosylamino)uracil reductase